MLTPRTQTCNHPSRDGMPPRGPCSYAPRPRGFRTAGPFSAARRAYAAASRRSAAARSISVTTSSMVEPPRSRAYQVRTWR